MKYTQLTSLEVEVLPVDETAKMICFCINTYFYIRYIYVTSINGRKLTPLISRRSVV
jgi:hypothetical protein